ncbi:hypothetical protein AVEN_168697-1 [Araneus ventricosus]|uniref:Uncharacterized protein n=1 Tax=Araneus ventricosus TaxID=182803 RepID=A0A4Y2T1R5_ARAVE|nr:hypothetical protein AVEN_168697-1 [Araneus ventricosus]
MRSRRISKQGRTSPGGNNNGGAVLPSPVIVRDWPENAANTPAGEGGNQGITPPKVLLCCLNVVLGGMGDVSLEFFSWQGHPRREGHSIIPSSSIKAMDKVRLLPSGVQGLLPKEAALSSFTMNRSPIVIFCGRAD